MSRKLTTLLLAALLLISVCAAASAATTYYVTSRRLNVREGAGTDYKILGQVTYGQKVEVYSINHGWALIQYKESDDGYGFVSSRCITKRMPTGDYYSQPAATNGNYRTFTVANYTVIVNPANSYVNMRWEASKASQVRRVYYYGAQLKVIAENGSWCQVLDETTGEVGYILKSLLLRTDGQPTSSLENG